MNETFPMTGAPSAVGSALVARIETSFAKQAFMTTLGARLVRVAPGEVEIALPVSAHLCQQHGFVHAGAVSTIADSAAGYAALTASALSSHDHQDELACIPIESPGIVSTLCMAQSAKKKSTPLIRRTSELLRGLCLEAAVRPLKGE